MSVSSDPFLLKNKEKFLFLSELFYFSFCFVFALLMTSLLQL